ncbi:hypothetical protein AGMMS50249_4100 [candidate division SR1 bacterium]|nr:hypothetical protein AGMMS50249_4100 [candidate division SR1 bacterium]
MKKLSLTLSLLILTVSTGFWGYMSAQTSIPISIEISPENLIQHIQKIIIAVPDGNGGFNMEGSVSLTADEDGKLLIDGSITNNSSAKGDMKTPEFSTILGGLRNTLSGATNSSLIGGMGNYIQGDNSSIFGGSGNKIGTNSDNASILGGEQNQITNGDATIIIGGLSTFIFGTTNIAINTIQSNIYGTGNATIGSGITLTGSENFVRSDGSKSLDIQTSNLVIISARHGLAVNTTTPASGEAIATIDGGTRIEVNTDKNTLLPADAFSANADNYRATIKSITLRGGVCSCAFDGNKRNALDRTKLSCGVSCNTLYPLDGICGPAHGYTSLATRPSDAKLCVGGTVSDKFLTPDVATRTCLGSNGGSNSACTVGTTPIPPSTGSFQLCNYNGLFQPSRNGRTGDAVCHDMGTVTSGDTINLSTRVSSPTITGYTFSGWIDENGNRYTAPYIYAGDGDHNWTAVWTPRTYEITFVCYDGTPCPIPLSVTYGQPMTRPTNIIKTGYAFDGWFDSTTGTGGIGNNLQDIVVRPANLWNIASDTTAYAGYTATPVPPSTLTVIHCNLISDQISRISGTQMTITGILSSYTVNFNAAGGYVSPTSAVSQRPFVSWTTPTAGFISSSSTNPTIFTFGATNATLTANCAVSGNSIILPTPIRTGYTFDGWYTSTGLYVGGGGDSYIPTGDTTLIAHWTPRPILTVYSCLGVPNTFTAQPGNSVPINANPPWPTFTVSFDPAGGIVSPNPIISQRLFASWTLPTAGSISSSSTNPTNYTFGTVNASITANCTDTGNVVVFPTPIRTGYIFIGWSTGGTIATIIGSGGYVYTPTGNILLTGHWTKIPVCGDSVIDSGETCDDGNTANGDGCNSVCQIEETGSFQLCNYNGLFQPSRNGRTGDAVCHDMGTVTSGDTINLSTRVSSPTITGYTFSGWIDENGNRYTAPYIYAGDGDHNWTAVWTPRTYEITFVCYDGTPCPIPLSVTYGQPMTRPTNIIKTGYAFDGWFDSTTGTGGIGNNLQDIVVRPANLWNIASDTTAYAGYTFIPLNSSILTIFHCDGTLEQGVGISGTDTIITGKLSSYTIYFDASGGFVDPDSAISQRVFVYWTAPTAGSISNPFTNPTNYTFGGVDASITGNCSASGNSITLPLPVWTGYTFDGWYTSTGLFVGIDGELYTPTGDTTLIAHWTKIPVCGDSVIDVGEMCDDGNTANGDGCNSVCLIEVEPTLCSGDIIVGGITLADCNVGATGLFDTGNFYEDHDLAITTACPEGYYVPTMQEWRSLFSGLDHEAMFATGILLGSYFHSVVDGQLFMPNPYPYLSDQRNEAIAIEWDLENPEPEPSVQKTGAIYVSDPSVHTPRVDIEADSPVLVRCFKDPGIYRIIYRPANGDPITFDTYSRDIPSEFRTDFTKAQHIFSGWYAQPNCQGQWAGTGTTIGQTGDLNLYACRTLETGDCDTDIDIDGLLVRSCNVGANDIRERGSGFNPLEVDNVQCGDGYHVPTLEEWKYVFAKLSAGSTMIDYIQHTNEGYNNVINTLKLPVVGTEMGTLYAWKMEADPGFLYPIRFLQSQRQVLLSGVTTVIGEQRYVRCFKNVAKCTGPKTDCNEYILTEPKGTPTSCKTPEEIYNERGYQFEGNFSPYLNIEDAILQTLVENPQLGCNGPMDTAQFDWNPKREITDEMLTDSQGTMGRTCANGDTALNCDYPFNYSPPTPTTAGCPNINHFLCPIQDPTIRVIGHPHPLTRKISLYSCDGDAGCSFNNTQFAVNGRTGMILVNGGGVGNYVVECTTGFILAGPPDNPICIPDPNKQQSCPSIPNQKMIYPGTYTPPEIPATACQYSCEDGFSYDTGDNKCIECSITYPGYCPYETQICLATLGTGEVYRYGSTLHNTDQGYYIPALAGGLRPGGNLTTKHYSNLGLYACDYHCDTDYHREADSQSCVYNYEPCPDILINTTRARPEELGIRRIWSGTEFTGIREPLAEVPTLYHRNYAYGANLPLNQKCQVKCYDESVNITLNPDSKTMLLNTSFTGHHFDTGSNSCMPNATWCIPPSSTVSNRIWTGQDSFMIIGTNKIIQFWSGSYTGYMYPTSAPSNTTTQYLGNGPTTCNFICADDYHWDSSVNNCVYNYKYCPSLNDIYKQERTTSNGLSTPPVGTSLGNRHNSRIISQIWAGNWSYPYANGANNPRNPATPTGNLPSTTHHWSTTSTNSGSEYCLFRCKSNYHRDTPSQSCVSNTIYCTSKPANSHYIGDGIQSTWSSYDGTDRAGGWNHNSCDRTCNDGFHNEGGNCVSDGKTCQELYGSEGRTSNISPDGDTNWSWNEFYPIGATWNGTDWVNHRENCEATCNDIPSGMVRIVGGCSDSNKYVWDDGNKRWTGSCSCKIVPINGCGLEDGELWYPEMLETPAFKSGDPANDKKHYAVNPSATCAFTCKEGYTYNPSSKKCVKNPSTEISCQLPSPTTNYIWTLYTDTSPWNSTSKRYVVKIDGSIRSYPDSVPGPIKIGNLYSLDYDYESVYDSVAATNPCAYMCADGYHSGSCAGQNPNLCYPDATVTILPGGEGYCTTKPANSTWRTPQPTITRTYAEDGCSYTDSPSNKTPWRISANPYPTSTNPCAFQCNAGYTYNIGSNSCVSSFQKAQCQPPYNTTKRLKSEDNGTTWTLVTSNPGSSYSTKPWSEISLVDQIKCGCDNGGDPNNGCSVSACGAGVKRISNSCSKPAGYSDFWSSSYNVRYKDDGTDIHVAGCSNGNLCEITIRNKNESASNLFTPSQLPFTNSDISPSDLKSIIINNTANYLGILNGGSCVGSYFTPTSANWTNLLTLIYSSAPSIPSILTNPKGEKAILPNGIGYVIQKLKLPGYKAPSSWGTPTQFSQMGIIYAGGLAISFTPSGTRTSPTAITYSINSSASSSNSYLRCFKNP